MSSPDTWAYEMKWDGMRIVASIGSSGARLVTRNGNDVTTSYPEVAEALESSTLRDVVLDGEIVAFDDRGAPSFGRLQRRMGVTKPIDVRSATTAAPVHYLAFDVLEHGGSSLRSQTYDDRRGVLAELGIGNQQSAVVRVPPAFDGTLDEAIAASLEQGLEGVIAKRRGSTYRAGRSAAWVKIKHLRMQDVVICGWSPGQGSRSQVIGSLILGVHRDGELTFAGRVGTGFSDADLAALSDLLGRFPADASALAAVPADVARQAQWVEARFVGEVTFAEWTSAGHLRHASWRGLRPDVAPSDVEAGDM